VVLDCCLLSVLTGLTIPIRFPKSKTYLASASREDTASPAASAEQGSRPGLDKDLGEQRVPWHEFSAYMIREGAKWGFSWRGEEFEAGRRIVDGLCEGSAVHGWNWQQTCSGDAELCIQANLTPIRPQFNPNLTPIRPQFNPNLTPI